MEIQEVEVFISPNGEVSFGVRGVKGKKCLDITKTLEEDLGKDFIFRQETSEMYEQEVEEKVHHKLNTDTHE